LNPARAKLVRPEQKLRDYAWSSWPDYLKPPEQRLRWLRVDRLLGELYIPKDSVAGREELENHRIVMTSPHWEAHSSQRNGLMRVAWEKLHGCSDGYQSRSTKENRFTRFKSYMAHPFSSDYGAT